MQKKLDMINLVNIDDARPPPHFLPLSLQIVHLQYKHINDIVKDEE